ncbi:pyruvate oxidase [Halobacillus karajensis]|uniref:Thiamine pyrophosphate-containing protein YdaP n=1 Tax=Halobacillus karajensis TaxID=195088 RepID=A0A024P260_9BACI|nr:pyruvate oxidase [Halobacillus karajensis]CDQ19909.1 Putative thiamine pyrophosphate-containing protein YdaP [Halobacillus karajensis]CDQ22369.1 Putative thiamine pyrophosphate-containing protein YdaP [Halobacillus karajensis]CDQ28212.1 Putative thiamine pyrophosphate-containing protein YdaP [Halobacillus karajensis]
MLNKRTGEVLTQQLINWGVDHIYGMPGDSINELIEDLRKRKEEIEFIQVRHEETGALSAAAYAKLTGKIGVTAAIAGPGAVHLLNGLYDAKADSAPVLAIVGQVHSEEVGTGAFQEINLERMFDDVAVFNRRAETEAQLPDLLNQAIKEAYTYKGVAVLIVPDDLFAAKQKEEVRLTSGKYYKAEVSPSQTQLNEARQLIENAEKPIILAGQGTRQAKNELIDFAETIKAPVILSLLAKGVIPDNHPYCLGQLGQIGTKPAYHAMKETDLLILVGTQFPYRDFLPEDVSAIQIDNKSAHLGKYYPIEVGLPGDSKETLSALTKLVQSVEKRAYLEHYQEKMNEWRIAIQEEKRSTEDPLHAPQVMYELEKHVQPGAIISGDVGNVTVWLTRFLHLVNQKFILSGWLATMGSGLPGAIAAKKAHPEKQVIGVAGDGGFSMVMHDFVTAVKYNLPIKMIVLNNSKIGMIKYEQEQMGHLNYVTNLGEVDFAKFAEACGGEGIRIESYEELESKMKQAFISDQPVLVDVVIEDQAPLPGKIEYQSAVNFSKYIIKEFFESGNLDLPDMVKALKRLR